MRRTIAWLALFVLGGSGVVAQGPAGGVTGDRSTGARAEEAVVDAKASTGQRLVTLGGGCFWCVEAVFQQVKGVEKVVSGYAGGHVVDPTYEQVCTGLTGHAEVCQITYDPAVVSFTELLEIFWKTHDPTTYNRQGNDVGPQYRSVILCEDEEQKEVAESLKAKLDASGAFRRPIATQIARLETFYPGENYHQNYYQRHQQQGYCQLVIVPKLEKLKEVFRDKLKEHQ